MKKKGTTNPYVFMVVAIALVILFAFQGYNESKDDPVEKAIAERDARLTSEPQITNSYETNDVYETDNSQEVVSDSNLDMIDSNADYQDMLDFYYNKFFSLMKPFSDNQIMETEDHSQRLKEITDTISKLDASSDELSAYFDEFDKHRTTPPMGTKIMDLLFNAQYAVADYKIAMRHLYDGIINNNSEDIELSNKYLGKVNEELQAFHQTYNEESSK